MYGSIVIINHSIEFDPLSFIVKTNKSGYQLSQMEKNINNLLYCFVTVMFWINFFKEINNFFKEFKKIIESCTLIYF